MPTLEASLEGDKMVIRLVANGATLKERAKVRPHFTSEEMKRDLYTLAKFWAGEWGVPLVSQEEITKEHFNN